MSKLKMAAKIEWMMCKQDKVADLRNTQTEQTQTINEIMDELSCRSMVPVARIDPIALTLSPILHISLWLSRRKKEKE